MRHRSFTLFVVATAVTALVTPAWVSVAGQIQTPGTKTKTASRTWTTAWGDPDLQGVYDVAGITPLERPKQFANKEFLTDEEAVALEKRAEAVNDEEVVVKEGDTGYYNRFWRDPGKINRVVPNRRSSMIIDPPDGRLPPLTPQAQQIRGKIDAIIARDGPMVFNRVGPSRLAREGSRFADSYLDRDNIERCMSASLPKLLGAANNSGVQIVQGPGFVVLNYENRDTRVIPLDGGPHLPAHVRLWLGDARGRWEGRTLVVDTTNFTDEQGYRYVSGVEGSFPQGQLHLIERYTRIDDHTLNYEATIDDPATFTRPWTVAFPWQADDNYVIYENACHEGNDSLTNILSGARAQERATVATEGTKTK
jgi:hypothetical protein